ncbi:hypothetical protein HNV12_29710 [Methanococcoides sp. SA1]|nr:hypothetical protein [Methanococcoides sp. SA1]
MDSGSVFLGAIFLIVAIYIILFVESPTAKLFGGGVMGVLAILILIKGFKAK